MTTDELLTYVKKKPIGVGCGVLAFGLALAIYFRSGGIPDALTELDQRSAEGERFAANIKNGSQLADQLAALATEMREIDNHLVQVGELAKNLQYFYKLEADTGTKLLDLRQNQSILKKTSASYAGISYTVSVQGEYPQLLDFLRRLENGSHYCRIMTASIHSVNADTNRMGSLTLNLSLELLGVP